MKLTLQQLKVFATIARYGNLGLAANELCLSKGAVSQSLQELERQLSTPLFDRIHPRLQLNNEGRLLQPAAEELLTRMQDIENLFSPDAEPSGQLRLGASQTIGNYLLPTLLASSKQELGLPPKVTINNTHLLCHALANFELDMALIEGENHHPDLLAEPWLQDEMLVVAPPGHPLANKKELSLSRLGGETWVLREAQSGSREQFIQQIQPELPRWQPGLELNTLEAVMLAVEKGLGISFISRLAASDRLADGRLIALPLSRRFPRQLSLIWHKQKYHSTSLRHFIHFCRAQVNNAEVSRAE
ncbi:LysR family transcriptional regulator [Aeromonas veronii]|jgi:DNA-binding transcriptional LysR family regulator|uniref:LysR substrate-binding domain-containing protein n=1 Tax=Aeromonas TaxID=642 RepID=UPI0002E08BBF|nr:MULTISPECIES: LysR substrate-binding domain-containing protein [Aeromonas]ATY80928.1 LysR family transcriptional regulator [Aeromonas veronii]EKP0314151.1 LysR family transcriptional regulator [Aeromonas veronii]MBL0476681.1 LysR family transcriptional regulator [Aeromonas veronii]MBO0397609.1 LysR family transcriptional regulator [Aeromonas veronii]MBS4702377.1 LysR family transcriptional regulator [Aeromonas veronii]